jgi:hypothetical protein
MPHLGLNVRKLAAIDMALHETRFILIEFGVGVLASAVLCGLSLAQGLRLLRNGFNRELGLGFVLLWIGLNYVPLFIHAIDLARRGTARQEAGDDLDRRQLLRRYSAQQFWLLVPFAVVVLDLTQRFAANAARSAGPPSRHRG